ncbi:hypothetical protein MT418_000286 [Batrachochytrium dendrobatidis]
MVQAVVAKESGKNGSFILTHADQPRQDCTSISKHIHKSLTHNSIHSQYHQAHETTLLPCLVQPLTCQIAKDDKARSITKCHCLDCRHQTGALPNHQQVSSRHDQIQPTLVQQQCSVFDQQQHHQQQHPSGHSPVQPVIQSSVYKSPTQSHYYQVHRDVSSDTLNSHPTALATMLNYPVSSSLVTEQSAFPMARHAHLSMDLPNSHIQVLPNSHIQSASYSPISPHSVHSAYSNPSFHSPSSLPSIMALSLRQHIAQHRPIQDTRRPVTWTELHPIELPPQRDSQVLQQTLPSIQTITGNVWSIQRSTFNPNSTRTYLYDQNTHMMPLSNTPLRDNTDQTNFGPRPSNWSEATQPSSRNKWNRQSLAPAQQRITPPPVYATTPVSSFASMSVSAMESSVSTISPISPTKILQAVLPVRREHPYTQQEHNLHNQYTQQTHSLRDHQTQHTKRHDLEQSQYPDTIHDKYKHQHSIHTTVYPLTNADSSINAVNCTTRQPSPNSLVMPQHCLDSTGHTIWTHATSTEAIDMQSCSSAARVLPQTAVVTSTDTSPLVIPDQWSTNGGDEKVMESGKPAHSVGGSHDVAVVSSTATTAPDSAEPKLACLWVFPSRCVYSFASSDLLYRHICDDHIGRKTTGNLCLDCHWDRCTVFRSKRDHLTSHIRVHLKLRPHACTICGRTFKRMQDLNKHSRIHMPVWDTENRNLIESAHSHMLGYVSDPGLDDMRALMRQPLSQDNLLHLRRRRRRACIDGILQAARIRRVEHGLHL